MNHVAKKVLIGATIGASTGMTIDFFEKRKNDKKKYTTLPDSDMRNSFLADKLESVNADMESAEKGLTQLDSTYRSEWQGMGYPQTNKEINT